MYDLLCIMWYTYRPPTGIKHLYLFGVYLTEAELNNKPIRVVEIWHQVLLVLFYNFIFRKK